MVVVVVVDSREEGEERVDAEGARTRCHQVHRTRNGHKTKWEPYVDGLKDAAARATLKLQPLRRQDRSTPLCVVAVATNAPG